MSKPGNHSQPSAGNLREIGELAEYIANEWWRDDYLDPVRIIHDKKIGLSFDDYEDAFDGMIEYRRGRFHIHANLRRLQRQDSPRSRFTLSHELGHFFIDDHRRAIQSGTVAKHPSFGEYESKNPAEREADHFACNLLLPESRYRPLAAKAPTGLATIIKLADKFKTSLTSTAIRYASLNIKPCALLKWSANRLDWKWISGSTREAGFRVTINRPNALPPDCPTARALRGDAVTDGIHQAGTTASAWFPSVRNESFRNVILMEQAMRLGAFGVLTLIYPHSGAFDFSALL